MKRLKLLKNSLVFLDVILIIGIIVFLFNSFLFPANINWLSDMPKKDSVKTNITPPPPIQYYKVISLLPNPIEAPKKTDSPLRDTRPLAGLLQVEGTMPNSKDPKKASALLQILTKKQNVLVYYGEEILDQDGNKVSGLEGVKIVEVYFNKVVFDNNGKREELSAPDTDAPPISSGIDTMKKIPPSTTFSRPYDSKEFSTDLVKDDVNKKEWEVDERERDWLMQNHEVVLNSDLTFSFASGGGVKIDSVNSGSIVSARGFQSGDIIKTINGMEVKSYDEANKMFKDKALRNSSKVTVVIDRAGRDITIEYRLKRDTK
ncbi:MAG: hypothetical protein A2W23_06605 [Planctomycetes bacterium RBG_16_43_13]|nr:MAG: hypothetical protein A2W23_06605 [Planctomycetes bacterium RBG_16_43_13]